MGRVRPDQDWSGTYVAVVTSHKEVGGESVTTCMRRDTVPPARLDVATTAIPSNSPPSGLAFHGSPRRATPPRSAVSARRLLATVGTTAAAVGGVARSVDAKRLY